MLVIEKLTEEVRKSNATGSPLVRRAVWHIKRASDGRVLDTATTSKAAKRIARLMPITDIVGDQT